MWVVTVVRVVSEVAEKRRRKNTTTRARKGARRRGRRAGRRTCMTERRVRVQREIDRLLLIRYFTFLPRG